MVWSRSETTTHRGRLLNIVCCSQTWELSAEGV